jgi:hypothetical protein
MRPRSFAQLGLILVAASLMLLSNRAATAQSGGMRNVDFDGVSFSYDASLAGGVESTVVPEAVVTGGSGTWLASPQHIEFNFTDFHGSSAKWQTPTISIFPVRSDYTSLTPDEKQDLWLPRIQALQQVLSTHPDPQTMIQQMTISQGSPPEMGYLPPINAATVLTGKLGYLRFQNGLGIHFLVQTSQDASPPGPDNTSYTFQGLTNDDKYYMAAFFSAFPTTIAPIQPPTADNIRGYYLDLIDRFDKISNDAYTPNLDILDKMIGSLSVHPTNLGDLPGLPNTGDEAPIAQTGNWFLLTGFLLLCGGLALLRRARAVISE